MAEHDRLIVHTATLEAAITAGNRDAVYDAFAMLNADLVAHLAKEDAMIYPRLIAGDDAASSAAARDVIDECHDLATDWLALCAWATRQAIADQPARFASEAAGLMARLRRRVACENELLYPEALRAAHIRLCG